MTPSVINKSNLIRGLFPALILVFGYALTAQTGQRFKRIDYDYDQISGKVNEVHYQAGEADAFYHKYEYDADNRIINVFTSKDSVIWDNDARYQYYAHGPLARVVLGNNQVQGMDYVYTLQGWIKGVNSNLLISENDIGNDGLAGSPNNRVAKDAFGYTLNYRASDYKSIESAKWSNTAQRFEALTPNSDLMAVRFDLFNGNIGSMVTTIVEPKVYTGAANEKPNILPQGTAYRYDQLNRLLEMKAFQNLGTDPAISTTFNKWRPGSTYANLYHNTFQYDANGNILKQIRADGAGKPIDSLIYNYVKDASGSSKSNRLYHVNDKVIKTDFTDDMEDQGAFNADYKSANNGSNNYRYDEIGNLTRDKQEGIDSIEWTVYSKIRRMIRTLGNLRSDLEFRYDAIGNRIAKIEKPRDANGVKPQNDWITTYYTRDAQGNVMGIYKFTRAVSAPSFKVVERQFYGGSLLGSDYNELELVSALPPSGPFIRILGNIHFVAGNHLENVLAVCSDRKIPRDDDGDGVVDYFQSEVLIASDYSPFGVILDGRDWGVNGRYGFNGKEMDDEVKGDGNQQDYGMRTYDPRLGRFLSIDPLAKEYPYYTPYQFAGNKPVRNIDIDGLEEGISRFATFATTTYTFSNKKFNFGIGVQYKLNEKASLTLNVNNYVDNNNLTFNTFVNINGIGPKNINGGGTVGISTNQFGEVKLFSGRSKLGEINRPSISSFSPSAFPTPPVTNVESQLDKNFNEASDISENVAKTNYTNADATIDDGKIKINKPESQTNSTPIDPHQIVGPSKEEIKKVNAEIDEGVDPYRMEESQKKPSSVTPLQTDFKLKTKPLFKRGKK